MAKKKKDKSPAPDESDADELNAQSEGEAGEGEDGAEGAEGGKKKLPLVKIAIFAGVPLVLLIVGVTAAFMLGVFGGNHDAKTAADEAAEHKPAAEEVQFYDLPEILVNLNTGGKDETYLKLQVAIEIPKDAQVTSVEAVLPRILDRFQVFLRELRLEDLNGSAGTYRLKQELLRRVRLSGLAVPVSDVLIREMIIQ